MKSIDKEALIAARKLISPHLHETPVLSSAKLNAISGAQLFFKCENFQKTGSFKARGASNAVLQLPDAMAERGVATHSSGNHGQALAWAAQKRGIPAYIVMPENAPQVKVEAVAAYGAELIFCESTLEARESGLAQVEERTGAQFIPPYNHPHIIAGQSTAGQELFEQVENLDSVFTPVGGGGLLAGTALSSHYFSPRSKIFAAEPSGADDAFRSFYSGNLVQSHQPNTIADGLRTTLGPMNYDIIKDLVEDIFLVDDAEIIASMKLIYQYLKIVIEPSCAVPLAAILKNQEAFLGQKIGVILSGGNVDLNKLAF